MKVRDVFLSKEAVLDIEEGRTFYDKKEKGVGDYFFYSLISDLESLKLYAGMHNKKFGFYRAFSKRFPFAIYYGVEEDIVKVIAVLDMRRNPSWIRSKLENRKS